MGVALKALGKLVEWFAIPVLIGVIALTFAFIAGGCGNSKPDTRPPAASTGVRGDDSLDVVRVPVYGRYVTCVRFAEAISTGGAGGLSCDWVGYHQP